MDLTVTIVNDNTDKVKDALKHQIQNGLTAIGMTAEGYAKRLTPVDTSRLRNSITFATSTTHGTDHPSPATEDDYTTKGKPEENAVYIGTNVEYAPYIEEGSGSYSGAHMLRIAATTHSDEYKKLLEDALKA